MKFIHLADLHLGKSVAAFPMLEEQRSLLFGQVLPAAQELEPDGVLIAGDVFDRANPSAEALALFDDFLVALNRLPKRPEVFVISGNHDGAERIAYGARILGQSGLHMSPVYDGDIRPVVMHDDYGPLDVYMLPFVRTSTVKDRFPDEEIASENDAVAAAVRHMGIDPARRTVCLAHQFVSGATVSGAEETAVGGLDCVSAEVFNGIDYVALGHIHRPQQITPAIRYAGSPLKYSFAEVGHKKSLTVVDIRGKGDVSISERPLMPVHDWFDLRGTFRELASEDFRARHPEYAQGYLRITLTDENDIVDGFKSLRAGWEEAKKTFDQNKENHYAGEEIQLQMNSAEKYNSKKSTMDNKVVKYRFSSTRSNKVNYLINFKKTSDGTVTSHDFYLLNTDVYAYMAIKSTIDRAATYQMRFFEPQNSVAIMSSRLKRKSLQTR